MPPLGLELGTSRLQTACPRDIRDIQDALKGFRPSPALSQIYGIYVDVDFIDHLSTRGKPTVRAVSFNASPLLELPLLDKTV
jgi:hypothetical protein